MGASAVDTPRFIRVSGHCDSEWYEPTNHFKLGDYPHHVNKGFVYGSPVASP